MERIKTERKRERGRDRENWIESIRLGFRHKKDRRRNFRTEGNTEWLI